jgi:hypothetical protein
VNVSLPKDSSPTREYETKESATPPFQAPTAFEHITLNTGHSCTQVRDSVSDDVAERMAALIRNGLQHGGWTTLDFDGEAWPIHVELIDSAVLVGIFLPSENGHREKPVVAIGVSAHQAAGARVWERLHAHAGEIDARHSTSPPNAPWICVSLDLYAVTVVSLENFAASISLMSWLGDFERCLAWGFVSLLETTSIQSIGASMHPARQEATHHPAQSGADGYDVICIGNRGQAIASTNYWDCQAAKDGIFYLSWNAGAARLLVPDCQKHYVKEMRSAKHVVISRGPMPQHGRSIGLELLFEDNSDQPFVLMIPEDASDRRLPKTDQGSEFFITVWTRGGQKLRLPCRYREVEALPCLKAWASH